MNFPKDEVVTVKKWEDIVNYMYKYKLSQATLSLVLKGQLNLMKESKFDVIKNDFLIVGFCKKTKYFKTIHDKENFKVTKHFKYSNFLKAIKPCFKECFFETLNILVEMKKEQLIREGTNGLFDLLLQVKMPYMHQGEFTNMNIYIAYCEYQNKELVYLFMKPVINNKIEIFKANILNKFKDDPQADKRIRLVLEKNGEVLIKKILSPIQKIIFIHLLRNRSIEEIAEFLGFAVTRVSKIIVRIFHKFTDFFRLNFSGIHEIVDYFKDCFLISEKTINSKVNISTI